MKSTRSFTHLCVLLGGGLGCIVVMFVAAGQINLTRILQGKLPLEVGISIAKNSFSFLISLLVIFLLSIAVEFLIHPINKIIAAITWLVFGLILVYAIYLSRFSIGQLIIPSTFLLILAGGLTLVEKNGKN